MPTMCVLTITYKHGYHEMAKSRIVVWGNQQRINYQPNEKNAPVLTQTQFRVILSITIKKTLFATRKREKRLL